MFFHREPTNSISSVVSVSVSALSFCTEFLPALPWCWTETLSQRNPFPDALPLVMVPHHSGRKQTRAGSTAGAGVERQEAIATVEGSEWLKYRGQMTTQDVLGIHAHSLVLAHGL